jgi:hypothetical protein
MEKTVMGFGRMGFVVRVRRFGGMKIVMGFGRMGFVVRVRRFGEMKITGKLLSEFLNAECRCRLKE